MSHLSPTEYLKTTDSRKASPSPPRTSAFASTGRPSLWDKSQMRKMCRLYLYTTLKPDQILRVIHHDANQQSMPGENSANKKLKAMLNKEYRWLKPRDEGDMKRRYEALCQSPMRSRAAARRRANAPKMPRSSPASPAFAQGLVTPIKTEAIKQEPGLASPTAFDRIETSTSPCFPDAPSDGWMGEPWGGYRATTPDILQRHEFEMHSHPGSPRSRRGSDVSTSTEGSTGSFSLLLPDRDADYRKMVRRILKRYTVPTRAELEDGVPAPPSGEPCWSADPDAARPFSVTDRPYPLPSDYLHVDTHCPFCATVDPERHQKQLCMCRALKEGLDLAWVTIDGPTDIAQEVMTHGLPISVKPNYRDVFGNTALHLLAARGRPEVLCAAVQREEYAGILTATNTAGQTFLHALSSDWFSEREHLMSLLDILGKPRTLPDGNRFDVAARDHYGRTFLHMGRIPGPMVTRVIVSQWPSLAVRCALGQTPTGSNTVAVDSLPAGYGQDSPTEHGRLLGLSRAALDIDPRVEDGQGRNGLHCLAMAPLSVGTFKARNKDWFPLGEGSTAAAVASSSSSSSTTGAPGPPSSKDGSPMDSSEARLLLRKRHTQRLLDVGVDANHRDHRGNTPLMAYCAELPEDDDYKVGPDIIRLLVRGGGASTEARNRAGETALHVAVRTGRKRAASTLVELGANVHARDGAGRGVLELADAKMASGRDCSSPLVGQPPSPSSSSDANVPHEYCHYEACRAYLSGRAGAVQEPTVLQEWGVRHWS